MEASQQAQVDAITKAVEQVGLDVATTKDKIQEQMDAIEAQIAAGGAVDLTALKAAVEPLDAHVLALQQIKPTPPPVASAPAPPPSPPAA